MKVDGVGQGAINSYTFSSVAANHTISASFSLVPAVIEAESTPNYICPSNPCVAMAVTLNRTYTNPVLAYSVKFTLSPNLSLCSGTGSVTEGPFLSSAGSTSFNVVANGGGTYTVDCAVLAGACGPTATSSILFVVGVKSSDPGGAGSITVNSVSLRDCANQALAANPGPPGTVPIDNVAPSITERWFVRRSCTLKYGFWRPAASAIFRR